VFRASERVFGRCTRYLAPGTRYQVPGTGYLVPSTWYQVPCTGDNRLHGTRYLVPNILYLLPEHLFSRWSEHLFGVSEHLFVFGERFRDQPCREVVCAGFVLLTYLSLDETVAARLAASPEALAAIAGARAQWPKEVEGAVASCTHYMSSTAAALLKGSPPTVAKPRMETPRRSADRFRPVRAAAACVVGGAGGKPTY
jgi:hypothetical protein